MALGETVEALRGAVRCAAEALGQPTYFVGGYVRDRLLGRTGSDVDIVTVGSGIALAERAARLLGARPVRVFRNFGTAYFRFQDVDVEFVGARRESYRADSRKPLVEEGTIEEDLSRRDFTINALAIPIHPAGTAGLLDLFDGESDLRSGLIRTPRDPVVTFRDDPLRMLRAVRFATCLGFRIDGETGRAIVRESARLGIVSRERVVEEFHKILMSQSPSRGLSLLEELGLLRHFLPDVSALRGVETQEGHGHKDNFYHTARVVENVRAAGGGLWLRWAALLHDVGKAQTKRYEPGQGWTFHGHEHVGSKMVPRIFRELRLPRDERMRYVQKLVRLHMRPIALVDDEVTDSAVRRLLFDAGDSIEDLMRLCEADVTSRNPVRSARYLRNFRLVRGKMEDLEARDAVRNFQPPVSGERIMLEYGLAPGPAVGALKHAIKEAILEGEIRNDLEEALAFMRVKALELGLSPRGAGGPVEPVRESEGSDGARG